MIDKIENWDNIEPNYGEWKRLPAGGYICKVIAVAIEKSKKGNDMIVINFDIAEGEYKDYFWKMYKDAPRNENLGEPRWGGRYYITLNTEGYEQRLKSIITSFEESNTNYKWDWDEQKLKGKKFGGIFRDEEYLSNGTKRTSTKLWQIRSAETITSGKFEIPKPKELSGDDYDKWDQIQTSAGYTVNDNDMPF